MTKLSTTLLAVVFATSPFLARALHFSGPDFKVEGVPQPWVEDNLQGGLEKFYGSVDAGEPDGVIAQIHDYSNAKFDYFGRVLTGENIGAALRTAMVNLKRTYETEISSAKCTENSDHEKVEIKLLGKVTVKQPNEENHDEGYDATITFVKHEGQLKVFSFKRVFAELEPKANVSQ
ncbi:uncharacterized protein MELLADRAFT_123270 [Melampsora larici-populina 98AG31]|uniref:Secreted protein n=1 Tax=Melampsora larici-populina (strain 98AG31 / pathotype 3-4-7) TaxID=747676 RepID=F4S0Q1_MELLP|nr:uncharacterized protein MELLADRAFT_123270 [Melampsora larici-populina 98AG31]EGG01801.1 secreted protein [Melampsora larici-populina 98AG31]